MKQYIFSQRNKGMQILISSLIVGLVALLCFSFSGYLGYRTIALILMMTLSILAMFLDIFAVLAAAFLSALIWNYFFIPPRFTLAISSAEDALMFMMYFVIAIVNAVLTYKIRQLEKTKTKREEKEHLTHQYNQLLKALSKQLQFSISDIAVAANNLTVNKAQLTSEYHDDLITEISESTLRLNEQIEDLVNASLIETGSLSPQKSRVAISTIIHETVRRLEKEHDPFEVHISVPPGMPEFSLDSKLIQRMLYHLLQLTTQSKVAGKRVEVSVMLHINVLKITIEYAGNSTEISFKKPNVLEHPSDMGELGLYLAKGFAEVHDGKIKVQHTPEGKTELSIAIPTETLSESDKK